MRREATAPARPVHITLSDDLSSIASILVILLNNTLFKNQGYLMAAKVIGWGSENCSGLEWKIMG